MGRPCSIERRERLLARMEAGCSCAEAAWAFGVPASTAVQLARQQRLQGHVVPEPQGRATGRAGKLDALQAEPDLALKELAEVLSEARRVRVHVSSLHRALQRAGYS